MKKLVLIDGHAILHQGSFDLIQSWIEGMNSWKEPACKAGFFKFSNKTETFKVRNRLFWRVAKDGVAL